jgi:hypothetical protein
MAAATPHALIRRAAWVLAAAWLAACDGGSQPSSPPAPPHAPADAGPAELEIGRGETIFAPIEKDQALPYVRGSQGGFHVWISFRVRGLDPERVLIAVTTKVEGHDDLELERRGRQNFVALDEEDAGAAGTYEYTGWPAQIRDAPKHVGERVDIHVHLQDVDARIVNGDTTATWITGVSPCGLSFRPPPRPLRS